MDSDVKTSGKIEEQYRESAVRPESDGGRNSLTLAGSGNFLHLPFLGYDRQVQQGERQNDHH